MPDMSLINADQFDAVDVAIGVLTCIDASVGERVEAAKALAEQFGLPWPPYSADEDDQVWR